MVFFGAFSSLGSLRDSFGLVTCSVLSPCSSGYVGRGLCFFVLVPSEVVGAVVGVEGPAVLATDSKEGSCPGLYVKGMT